MLLVLHSRPKLGESEYVIINIFVFQNTILLFYIVCHFFAIKYSGLTMLLIAYLHALIKKPLLKP